MTLNNSRTNKNNATHPARLSQLAHLSDLFQPFLRVDQGRLVGIVSVEHHQRRLLHQALREPAASDEGVDALEQGLELEKARFHAGILVEMLRRILYRYVSHITYMPASAVKESRGQ